MTRVADVEFFEFDGSRIAYRKYGYGDKNLLAFHGFGQSGHAFSLFEESVGQAFTVYAFDLFFHGNSSYHNRQLLTKSDWQRLIDAFLQTLSIDRFSLMGFSLGGRFALATAEAFPDRLTQLILLAPDGITRSFWYQSATGSATGRWLFKYVLRNLSMFTQIGHALTRMGLLNRTAMRFAEISLGTPKQRDLVYKTWTQFRLITPDLDKVCRLLNQKSIEVQLFTGAFDRIVPGNYVLPLTRQLRQYELTVFRTGHNHLIELTAERLAQRPLYNLPKTDNRHDDQADDD